MTVTWRTSFYTPNFPGLPAFGQTWPDPNTGQTWTYGLSGWQNPSTTPTATNLTIDNSGNAPDQDFGNVTMLLRMDGAIGSQTFTDSSLYALTISVFGSAQIADQYKKSGNGSGYFNGNGSYLTNSTRLAYAFYDKDFTIEGWFYTVSSADNQTLFSIGSYTDGILVRRSNGTDKLYINNTPYDYDLSFFPVDTWVHVALTRSSGEVNLWINGISRLTFTDTSSVAPSGPMAIAASVHSGYQENFAGYIDDFRITLGACRYSGSFTPGDSTQDGKAAFDPIRLDPEGWWDISDSEMVVLSGSKISQWKDKTPNRYDLSQSDNSLRPTYLQSQVKTKPVADWGPDQNNIYMSTGTLAQPVTVREMYCVLRYETIGDTFLNYPGIVNPYNSPGWTTLSGSGAYTEWTPWEYYINGNETSNRAADLFDEIKDTTLLRIKAPAGVSAQSNIIIGMDRFYTNYGRGWRGYFCEVLLFSSPLSTDQRKLLTDHLRAKWGIRRDVFFAYTSLLLHMNAPVDSNTVIDSSSNSFSSTRFGNAELSSELFRFGCSALSLNGADSYIETQANAKFLLETGDFTVECWAYTSSANTRNGLFQFGESGLRLYIEDGNWHLAPTNSSGVQMGAVVPDTWQHIAVIRNLNVVRMFINGSQIGADLDYTGIALGGNQLRIGTCSPSSAGSGAGAGAGYVFSFTQDDWTISGDFSPSVSGSIGSFIGKIDEFRVTKGVCRYRGNSFAVPSSPFRSS